MTQNTQTRKLDALVDQTSDVLDRLFDLLAEENTLLRNGNKDIERMDVVIQSKLQLSNEYYELCKALKAEAAFNGQQPSEDAMPTPLTIKLEKLKAALFENQRLLRARHGATRKRVDAIMEGMAQHERKRQPNYQVIPGGKALTERDSAKPVVRRTSV